MQCIPCLSSPSGKKGQRQRGVVDAESMCAIDNSCVQRAVVQVVSDSGGQGMKLDIHVHSSLSSDISLAMIFARV